MLQSLAGEMLQAWVSTMRRMGWGTRQVKSVLRSGARRALPALAFGALTLPDAALRRDCPAQPARGQRHRHDAAVDGPQRAPERRHAASRPAPASRARADARTAAGGRFRHDRPQQGAVEYGDPDAAGFRPRQIDEPRGLVAAAGAERLHQRHLGEPVPARRAVPRLHGFAHGRRPAGTGGLPERRARQRVLRRHRELGLHPGIRDQAARRVPQQSRLRPQRARRCDLHRDEERLQLSGPRDRAARRLELAPFRHGAGRHAAGQYVVLRCRRRAQRQRLA